MRKAGFAAFLVLAGCMGSNSIRPLRPLEIPTAPYYGVTTTALAGSLMYEGNCLLFRDDQTGILYMPVWPVGSSFNGSALLVHHPGKSDQWVVVAQEILMYGEPLQWSTFTAAAYRPFSHQCGAYRPFYVSGIRPAD